MMSMFAVTRLIISIVFWVPVFAITLRAAVAIVNRILGPPRPQDTGEPSPTGEPTTGILRPERSSADDGFRSGDLGGAVDSHRATDTRDLSNPFSAPAASGDAADAFALNTSHAEGRRVAIPLSFWHACLVALLGVIAHWTLGLLIRIGFVQLDQMRGDTTWLLLVLDAIFGRFTVAVAVIWRLVPTTFPQALGVVSVSLLLSVAAGIAIGGLFWTLAFTLASVQGI